MRRHQIDTWNFVHFLQHDAAGVFQPPEVGVSLLAISAAEQIVETHVLGTEIQAEAHGVRARYAT